MPSIDPEHEHFRLLVELQKQICWIYVLLARLQRIEVWSNYAGLPTNKRQASHSLQGMNDYQLLMHLDRLWRFLLLAKRYQLIDRKFGSKLKKISADVEFLRDKREHSENYMSRDKLVTVLRREEINDASFVWTAPDWSSTINSVRRLGGRLDVSLILPAVEQLYEEMQTSHSWVFPMTPAALIEAESALPK